MKRREFLETLGLAVAGAALAGCAPGRKAEPTQEPPAAELQVEPVQLTFAFSGTEERPSCHCATVTELPDGSLMLAWYAGSQEGEPDVAILSARLEAGGREWIPAKVLVPAAHHGQGNPVLFVDGRERVHLVYVTRYGPSWEECKIHKRISDDGGRTWGAEETIHDEFGWMVRNKPIRLETGELLLPIYDEREWSSMMLISADEGDSWTVHGEITAPTGSIQPTMIERSDGTLLALMRRGRRGSCIWTPDMYDPEKLSQLAEALTPCSIWQTTLPDDGRTWSETQPVSLPNPNAAIDSAQPSRHRMVGSTSSTPIAGRRSSTRHSTFCR